MRVSCALGQCAHSRLLVHCFIFILGLPATVTFHLSPNPGQMLHRHLQTALRMSQPPPPAKLGFQSPRAKLRALEVNKTHWDIDISDFQPFASISAPSSEGKNNMVGFRKGDAELLAGMAEDEEAAGNVTGASKLMSIADRMQVIMDRSEAKLKKKLDLNAQPSMKSGPENPLEAEAVELKWWPYIHEGLITKGRGVWCTSTESGPKSARGSTAFNAGSFVSWKFRVDQLSGPLCVGLASLAVDLDKQWTDDEYFNEAIFVTQNGNLYNGPQLIWESGTTMKTGDILDLTLDGNMVYVSINGEHIPAALGPVTGFLRFSVQINNLNDGITLMNQEQRTNVMQDGIDGATFGTLTLERNKQKATIFDEDASIINSLYSSDTGTLLSFSEPSSDTTETDEPMDILSLSLPAIEKRKEPSPWEMVVADSGKVYYWNKRTNETSWIRPLDFVPDAGALLKENDDKEAVQKIERINEDNPDLFFNNADGYQDSHKTIKLGKNGKPKTGRLVYVDEATCIGCTNCATIARNTFYMHDEHGRARAFRQGADADEIIDEAVSTCPVDCIWYVSWDDLVILEQERSYLVINNQARLVGGSNVESTGYFGQGGWGVYANKAMPGKSKASVMNRGGTRCNNCPGRGCYECPLYPVGEHPTYLAKAAERQERKRNRKLAKEQGCIAPLRDGGVEGLGDGAFIDSEMDLSAIFTDETSSFSDDTTYSQ